MCAGCQDAARQPLLFAAIIVSP
uniref:Uncharacterized protein n=1 Tax=Anguilla anguilla TaxID=7936 RepID=A0A0E9RPG6_ANGAN